MHILYVEDDARDSDLARRALTRSMPSWRLDVVSTVGEALDRLPPRGTTPLDVLLTDMRLPDGDGRDLLAYVRSRELPVAVVVITGAGDEEVAVSVLKAGADDYVVKREDYLARLPATLLSAHERFHAATARVQQRLRVLYAEHDVTDIDLTRRHLARHASHVELDVVHSIEQVWARLGGGDVPDILLLDYRLRGTNALEALKELRQVRGVDVPVVVVTGQGGEDVALQAIRLGAADYVVKGTGYLLRLPLVLENVAFRQQLLRERRALEEAMAQQRRLEKHLLESHRMDVVAQLAGGVAHDFNNLLTVISGHVSRLLASSDPRTPSHDSLEQVSQATAHAASLTRQLLTFSRRQVMQPTRLDLNVVVGGASRMLAPLLGEAVELRLDLAADPAWIEADRVMVEQVLLNLALNARDATAGRGRVTVGVSQRTLDDAAARDHPGRRPGRFTCLAMADTGHGIEPEHLPRVFEPFFTTKGVGQGTGLGLASAHGIALQHGGWIEVESEPGRGATFTVFLPQADAPAPGTPACPEPTEARGGSETILVVEDQPQLRDLMTDLLSGAGYEVLAAASGAEALEIWRRHGRRIALLLTDMVLPDGISGRDLTERLRGEAPGLRVLQQSGYSPTTAGTDLSRTAATTFLPKPYRPETLLLAVRAALDGMA
jgi:signal transduction histidine kinase